MCADEEADGDDSNKIDPATAKVLSDEALDAFLTLDSSVGSEAAAEAANPFSVPKLLSHWDAKRESQPVLGLTTVSPDPPVSDANEGTMRFYELQAAAAAAAAAAQVAPSARQEQNHIAGSGFAMDSLDIDDTSAAVEKAGGRDLMWERDGGTTTAGIVSVSDAPAEIRMEPSSPLYQKRDGRAKIGLNQFAAYIPLRPIPVPEIAQPTFFADDSLPRAASISSNGAQGNVGILVCH